MKILIVSSFVNFDVSKDVTAGGDQHLLILAREWVKNGNKIVNIPQKVHFDFRSIFIDSLKAIFTRANRYFLQDGLHNPDTIVSATPYPPDLIRAVKIGRLTGVRIHAYFHHITPSLFWKPFQRGFFRTILNRLYITLALSMCKINGVHIFLDQPNEYKLGSITVHKDDDAIEDYVLEEIIMGKKEVNNPNERDIDIFFIGRVSKNKGVLNIVKALKRLNSEGTLLNTVIAGPIYDRRYYDRIIKYTIKNELSSQIKFIGKISDRDKIHCFSHSRMFVFPSYEEGWALAVMEAAACRVPIVAFSLEAYSYLHGNYFVSEANPKSLAEAIKKCINDKELSTRLVENAYGLVTSYKYSKIANEHLQFFGED